MKVGIIDDDLSFINRLKDEIMKYDHHIIFHTYHDFNECVSLENIDLLFLDIMFGEQLSFDYGAKLLDDYPDLTLVYMSQFDHFVYDTYNQRTFYFIRKAYLEDEYKKFHEKYQREIICKKKTLEFISENINYTLLQSDIYFIESYRNQIIIITMNKQYTTYMTLKQVLEILDQSSFYRFNRSHIINLRHITNYDHKYIYIHQNKIPFTRGSKNPFIERYGVYRRNQI